MRLITLAEMQPKLITGKRYDFLLQFRRRCIILNGLSLHSGRMKLWVQEGRIADPYNQNKRQLTILANKHLNVSMEIINSRRDFIKQMVAVSLLPSTPLLRLFPEEGGGLDYQKAKISRIELFRYDVDIPRYFSWGTWYNRQHLFMKISAEGHFGWSEIPAAVNTPEFDPTDWVKYLRSFLGVTIDKAQEILTSQQIQGSGISCKNLEFIEMGLLDLSGRLQMKPAIELLGLKKTDPVPGLFCILDKDADKVKRAAEDSIDQNLSQYVKLKMYGERSLDLSLLRTVRDTIGKKAIVISDANAGYKQWKSLTELAAILTEFNDNGLNAIEDPAELTVTEWIQLQAMVGDLSLIPDYPLRPAWEGLKNIRAGMGRIYNLHPSTMGSFKFTAELANKVKTIGSAVMIGDDSLVGPACSAWQQIAIGAGAKWVEALEKKEDSKDFLRCLRSSATKLQRDGTISMNARPGFGLEIDVQSLKKLSRAYINVG